MEGTRIGRRRERQSKKGSALYRHKRNEIIAVGAQVFRELGLGNATLGDVAERLNTDRASLYYYFGSKKDLYREVVREAAERNIIEIEKIAESHASADEKLSDAIEALMEAYDRSFPYMHVFVQEDLQKTVNGDAWSEESRSWEARYYNAVHKIIEQGRSEGIFFDVPVGIATLGVIGTVNWAHRWYRPAGDLSTKSIGKTFSRILLDGLRKG